MGVSYIGYSALGILIPRNTLITISNIKSCNHAASARKGKFCSECGVKVEFTETENQDLFHDIQVRAPAYGLETVEVFEGDYNLKGIILGNVLHSNENTQTTESDIPDLNRLKALISKFLKENDIKLEPIVKFYSHLYISC